MTQPKIDPGTLAMMQGAGLIESPVDPTMVEGGVVPSADEGPHGLDKETTEAVSDILGSMLGETDEVSDEVSEIAEEPANTEETEEPEAEEVEEAEVSIEVPSEPEEPVKISVSQDGAGEPEVSIEDPADAAEVLKDVGIAEPTEEEPVAAEEPSPCELSTDEYDYETDELEDEDDLDAYESILSDLEEMGVSREIFGYALNEDASVDTEPEVSELFEAGDHSCAICGNFNPSGMDENICGRSTEVINAYGREKYETWVGSPNQDNECSLLVSGGRNTHESVDAGDVVQVDVNGQSGVGSVVAVSGDMVQVETSDGVVDVPRDSVADPVEASARTSLVSPVVVRSWKRSMRSRQCRARYLRRRGSR